MKSPAEYEKEFRARYARWSPGVWASLVDNQIPLLLAGNSSLPDPDAAKVLEAYVSLCGEAIGRGELSPTTSNLFQLLLIEKVPTLLPQLKGARTQIEMLATLWNICDGSATGAPWISTVLKKRLINVQSLSEVERVVEGLSRLMEKEEGPLLQTFPAKKKKLTVLETSRLGYFLPRKLDFLAPPVLLVTGLTPDGVVQLTVYAEDLSILSVEKVQQEIKAESCGLQVPNELPFNLTLAAHTSNSILEAAVFAESQNIWLWTSHEA